MTRFSRRYIKTLRKPSVTHEPRSNPTLKIGVGPYHWALLALCGWANAADAVEILVVSFILPATQTELHLSDQEKGLLTSVIFVGMMFGGWLWGVFADLRGRRMCLIYAMAVNATFGFLSAFSHSFAWLVFFRFMSGLGYI